MAKKVSHAHVLQLVQTLLKATILAKGDDVFVTREQAAVAEEQFDLRINPTDDGFLLSLRSSPEGDRPKLALPSESKLWTP